MEAFVSIRTYIYKQRYVFFKLIYTYLRFIRLFKSVFKDYCTYVHCNCNKSLGVIKHNRYSQPKCNKLFCTFVKIRIGRFQD
jgi:hypothetical protein